MERHESRSGPLSQKGRSQDHDKILGHGSAALRWAERGWEVFPLRPGTKGGRGNYLVASWKDATTDPDTIRAWWDKWPDANIGVATGARSGLVVIDVDGPDGEATLTKLETDPDIGPLPVTFTVGTPRTGGRHVYVAHPGGHVQNRTGDTWHPWGKDREPATGLDVRGDGGYAVLPPSVRPDGRYTVESGDADKLGELSPSWCELLVTGPEPNDGAGALKVPARVGDLFTSPKVFTQEQAKRYLWEQAVVPLRNAREGSRNHQLNASAMVAGHLIPGLLTQAEAVAGLTAIALEIGLDPAEIGDGYTYGTLESGLSAGMADPYTVTGGPDREMVRTRTQAIMSAVLDSTELEQLPDPVPMLAGYLNEAEAVWLAGKFGTYKSLVALAWSYAIATGRPWCGAEVKEPRPVVYVAAEGVTGLRKRLRALERHHGQEVPSGMLTIIRRPVHLERAEEVAALKQVIETKGARLIVLDTWHRMAGRAEENSSTEQAEPIDVAFALRDDYGATVLILDHTGHAQLHARGSSSKEDDCDASWMIKLGKGDAEDEDRSASTARTLVHRKAKDEDLRPAEQLRLIVDDQGEAVVEVDPIQPAPVVKRGRRARVNPKQATENLIAALDAGGVSTDDGEGPVREWIETYLPGQNITRAVVRSAIARRRARDAGTLDPFIGQAGAAA